MNVHRFVRVLSILLLLAGFALGSVLAADRHVYLDTNGNGQLNDCPNPAHNAKGTNNADELTYCVGGASARKIIGTATGRVTSGTCTGGGGAVANVTTSVQADVDGDGTNEPIYGHPQACVYNMARSDSCEIHAGTYNRPGAQCDEACGNGVTQDNAVCERADCWRAVVVAYGQGPNLGALGYGTAAAPGYIRGATMAGSVDTWDSNRDLIPDTESGQPTSYPVIFSGDVDRDGVFDTTTCSGGTCSGDSYYGVVIGCGPGGGYGSSYCNTSLSAGTWTKIDQDGDGSVTQNYGTVRFDSIKVDYLKIRDIEFQRFNGGNGMGGGGRFREGIIALDGNDNASSGLDVDHIYVHSNDYSLDASREKNWAVYNDSSNHGCVGYFVFEKSFIVQTNEKVIDDDSGPTHPGGCPKIFRNNRVHVNVTSDRLRTGYVVFAYLKSIDSVNNLTRKKDHRFYNNEFIVETQATKFWDIQEYGDDDPGNGPGRGEIWFYGNIVRDRVQGTQRLSRFWPGLCTDTLDDWYTTYIFNNTFDQRYNEGSDGIGVVCTARAKKLVERNNAYYQPRFVQGTTALTLVRSNESCSTSTDNPPTCAVNTSGRSVWFSGVASPGLYDGPSFYRPKSGGPLFSTGSCDPDGDGTAGVDYDADGLNDTVWIDILGNAVSCPTVGSSIHRGANQSLGGGTGSAPSNVSNFRRTDEH